MGDILASYPITHARIKPYHHPDLDVTVNGQTAVKYLRFMRNVKLEKLELPWSVYGRWVPFVPCHPAHLVIATFDEQNMCWQTVKEVDIPYNKRIAGEGLTQDMPIKQMEAHFAKILEEPPITIDMNGLETNCLRVECDREHPVWPNHGEVNGGTHNVPFGILNPLRAIGEARGPVIQTPYNRLLAVGKVFPEAPRGMKVQDLPHMLLFEGRYISIGFSLKRPLIMHLGWDILGKGKALNNRILASRVPDTFDMRVIGGPSGPIVRTLTMDSPCMMWSGSVSVEGNRIIYSNLSGVPGITVDATFTVEPKRILLELCQRCVTHTPVLEAEAWRLAWNETAGITGAAAVPKNNGGRHGEVELPMMWASDGVGCLSCRLVDGDPQTVRMQIESYQKRKTVTGGFVLAPKPQDSKPLILPEGIVEAKFELALANFEPRYVKGAPKPSEGIRRQWATTFSCFRPEYRGFSNHALSTNCHLSQLNPVIIAACTKKPKVGPDPIRLARFTIEKALLDGGGYGYWRNLYLDSDPVLIVSAGVLHSERPSSSWLRRIEPGLRASMQQILSTIGDEGLAICRDLSGNSGSYRWSSNGMDVVGFGHMDAYVNALTYVALRCAGKLFSELGDENESLYMEQKAKALRAAFAQYLLNPKTGWVVGWRSRDGELHDAAFMWVNGFAIAAGLLDDDVARKALVNLEKMRKEVGAESARIGLPFNLLPIHRKDHMLPLILGETFPTFENYTDGSLSAYPVWMYLSALQKYGMINAAKKLASEMDEGYACGLHSGGMWTGVEFRSWEGLPNGYEGTLIGCFGALYSIAIEQGLIEPVKAEKWWK